MSRERRPRSLWASEAIARALELEGLRRLFTAEDSRPDEPDRWAAERPLAGTLTKAERIELAQGVDDDITAAWSAINSPQAPLSRISDWLTGTRLAAASMSLNAAEAKLLRLAPVDHLESNLEVLISDAEDVLPWNDARLQRLRDLKALEPAGFTEKHRNTVVAAIDAAKKASLRAQARLRSFRNVVLIASALAAGLALAIALIGLFAPDTLPLCYQPVNEPLVCPASGAPRPADSLLIEFAGVLGATVSAVFALRKVRGSADPYSISVALAVLKLPTGALTAFLGLLLVSAGFVPGLTALDSSAQILAWAVVFGYSQELFTSVVDRQGQVVLAEANYRPSAIEMNVPGPRTTT